MRTCVHCVTILASIVASLQLARAQTPSTGSEACPAGRRVAAPTGLKDQWAPAVILGVDGRMPNSCRVHLLGYPNDMDNAWPAPMLKEPSAANMPIGGNANDPYLTGAGPKPRPIAVQPGRYQCSARSGGQWVPRLDLGFTIVDSHAYRDSADTQGTYLFDVRSSGIVFRGGKLDRYIGAYEQPAAPPTRSRPPTITLTLSGDTCELVL